MISTSSRCALRLLGTFLVLLIATRASAAEYSWTAPQDGNFAVIVNWSPIINAPPKTFDQAIFDRSANAGPAVDFTTNPINDRLLIRDDDVPMRLAGHTYTLTNSSAATPSLVVGELDQDLSDLAVLGGGRLQAVYGVIGAHANADAQVQVNGATLALSQTLTVASAGLGKLVVQAGGVVESQSAQLGVASTGDGRTTLSGNGRWTVTSSITVGGDGYGQLDATEDGQMSSGPATIGNGGTGQGFVSVEGTSAQWTVNGAMTIGSAGFGRVDVGAGGRVTTIGASLGTGTNGSGIVTVGGADARWNNTGSFNIGGSASLEGGEGTVFLEAGGTIDTTGAVHIWPGGLLSLRGGALTTPAIDNQGALEYLFGTLHLTASNMVISSTGLLGAPLAISPGMYMIVDQQTTVVADTSLAIIDGSYTSGTMNNLGRISAINGIVGVGHGGTNAISAKLRAIDSTLQLPTAANEAFVNEGRFDLIDSTVSGNLQNKAGAITSIGGIVSFLGNVSGGGLFDGTGEAKLGARFSPGDGVGQVFASGDITFENTATLSMEIGGTNPGTQYDQLLVDRFATLAGALEVNLVNAFVPAIGDQFTLVTYAGHSGQFAPPALPPLPAGRSWSVETGATALVLSVVGLAGDIDLDNDVDDSDFRQFANFFGTTSGAVWTTGDFNGDGKASLADLLLLRDNLGTSPSPGATAVPEPASLSLLVVFSCGVAVTRLFRRRG